MFYWFMLTAAVMTDACMIAMNCVSLHTDGAPLHKYVEILRDCNTSFSKGQSLLNRSMGEWAYVLVAHAGRTELMKEGSERQKAIDEFHRQRKCYHNHITQMTLCCEAFRRDIIPFDEAEALMMRLQNTEVISKEGKQQFVNVAREIGNSYQKYARISADSNKTPTVDNCTIIPAATSGENR
jgi:hypothetical protein